jgi:hypothetical protein
MFFQDGGRAKEGQQPRVAHGESKSSEPAVSSGINFHSLLSQSFLDLEKEGCRCSSYWHAQGAFAQANSDVTGIVTDQTGAVLRERRSRSPTRQLATFKIHQSATAPGCMTLPV